MRDLENQRFGLLVAKKYLPGGKWLCDCDCGKQKIVLTQHLIQKHTKSCGCLLKKNGHRVDITDQRFGMLVAKEPTNLIKNHSVVWRFKCDCDKECYATLHQVRWMGKQSCGCLSYDYYVEKAMYARSKCGGIDGSNVIKISSNKLNTNNTSGYKGVCWDKKYKKWTASLRFKYKKYYLGIYDKLEDAIKARAEGEKHIYGPFLEWYEEFKRQNIK